MRTSSADLFNLIKSMTKSEKGYFKKHANLTRGDKAYIKLFNAIEKQKVYDEEKIKEKFSNDQFVKQISVAKNTLYNILLKTLSQTSSGSNIVFELKAGVKHSELLFNKGLGEQSLKLIKKLKKTAFETEEFYSTLQLLNLEKNILLRSFDESEANLTGIYRTELEILERLREKISYQKLFNRSFYIITKFGHARAKKEEKVYDEILNDPLMLKGQIPKSLSSGVHYNEILFHFHFFKSEFEKGLVYISKCLEIMNNNEMFLRANIDRYFSVFQNYILQFFSLRRFNDVETYSKKLLSRLNEKHLNVPERVKITAAGKILCIRFVSSINGVDFKLAKNVFEEIKELLKNYNDSLDNSIKIILYNLSASYNFIEGNYNEALKWLNKLLNDPEMKYFVEIYCNARWFDLLVHYQLGNFNYIDNILKTNERYINKKQKLYGVEKLIIKFLENAISHKGKEENHLLEILRDDLQRVITGRTQSDYGIDYYNMSAWVESRIRKTGFKEFLESQA